MHAGAAVCLGHCEARVDDHVKRGLVYRQRDLVIEFVPARLVSRTISGSMSCHGRNKTGACVRVRCSCASPCSFEVILSLTCEEEASFLLLEELWGRG